jgi:hypothetical protein
MEGFDHLRQFARFIDSSLQQLSEAVQTGQFDAIQQDPDEDLLLNVAHSIDQHQSDLHKVAKQIDDLDDLANLIKNTRSAIDELKRYGILCDLPMTTDERRVPEQRRTPVSSPAVERKGLSPRHLPMDSSEVTYREIDNSEYQSLPSIVPLLVKFEDMNKHYYTLVESGKVKFTLDELSDLIPLSNSRLNAFSRALISLGRVVSHQDGSVTIYHLT